MKRILPVLLCLLWMLLVVYFIPSENSTATIAQAQANSAATLTPLAGLVQVQSFYEDPYITTGWHTVTAPTSIRQSDRVRTNGVGRATITYFEGAETQIQPNSLIQISTLILPAEDGEPYSISLDVLVGSALTTFTAAPAEPDRFVINTPNATAIGHAAQWCATSTPQGESIFSAEVGTVEIVPYVGSPMSIEVGGVIVFPYGVLSPLVNAACTDTFQPGNVPLAKPTCGNGRFDPGEDQTCLLDYPALDSLLPTCGNNACEPENGEDLVLCPSDCSPAEGYLCGDGTCQLSESGVTCPLDCWPDQSLGPQDPRLCGDQTCDPGESALSCPSDCAAEPPASAEQECGDRLCSSGEDAESCPADCTNPRPICGDQTCDQAAGETVTTCALDCEADYEPVCGDLFCDSAAGEDGLTCVQDCGLELVCACGQSASWSARRVGCGDGFCALTQGESLQTCPADCAAPPRVCGDNLCDSRLGENAESCPADCANRRNPHPTPTPLPSVTPRPTVSAPRTTPRPNQTPTTASPGPTPAPDQQNQPGGGDSQPPASGGLCGNGIIDHGEECDPPNGAECSAKCYLLYCGDTICSPQLGENANTCLQDCGYCGDSVCSPDLGENGATCQHDCHTCGDAICSTDYEDVANCPADCLSGCGDGVCDAGAGEDALSCQRDCHTCGDGTCSTEYEDIGNCALDCPATCGDTVCSPEAGEDCNTCSTDCGTCAEQPQISFAE